MMDRNLGFMKKSPDSNPLNEETEGGRFPALLNNEETEGGFSNVFEGW
jgi:hypothetical protein